MKKSRPVLVALLWALAMLVGYFVVGPSVLAKQPVVPTPDGAVLTATVVFSQTIATPPTDAPAPIDLETLSKGGFFTPILEVDNGGNTFTGYVRNDGLTAQGRVIRRDTLGATTGRWEVNVGSIQGISHKADGIAAVISGDDLLLTLTSHATNATGPRVMALWGAQLDNVAVPYPNGVRPTGAPGGNVGGSAASCETCPTLDQISALMDLKFAAFRAEFGGTGVRQGIEDKVKDAIGESFDRSLYATDPKARYVQDASAPFFRDRAYEGARSAQPTPTR